MAKTKAPAAKAAKAPKATPKAAPARARAKAAPARGPRAKAATAKVAETVTATAPVETPAVKASPAAEASAAPTPRAVESLAPRPVEAAATAIPRGVESLAPRPAEAVRPALKAIDLAVQAMAPKPLASPSAETVVAPVTSFVTAGAEQARQVYARAQATGATLRQAVAETATATSRGALEVNGKVIDAMQAQSDAAFDLWRSTLTAGSVSEAIRAQTSGARQVYETTASQWKDVAEATSRWFMAAVKPMQSVWSNQAR